MTKIPAPMRIRQELILIIVNAITKKVPCDKAATGLNGIEAIIISPATKLVIPRKRHRDLRAAVAERRTGHVVKL